MTCAIIVTGHSNPLGMTGIDPACYLSLLVLFEQFLCLLNLLLCLVLYFCGIFIDICDVFMCGKLHLVKLLFTNLTNTGFPHRIRHQFWINAK
jgi:hypothetical protein